MLLRSPSGMPTSPPPPLEMLEVPWGQASDSSNTEPSTNGVDGDCAYAGTCITQVIMHAINVSQIADFMFDHLGPPRPRSIEVRYREMRKPQVEPAHVPGKLVSYQVVDVRAQRPRSPRPV